MSLALASLLKVWGSYGGWSFASVVTLPHIWEKVTGTFAAGQLNRTTSYRVSNLYDMLVTPIEAGYHFSAADHIALSQHLGADRPVRSERARQSEPEQLDLRVADRLHEARAEVRASNSTR